MSTKLGWSLHGEKSIFQKSTNLIRNGWEWFIQYDKLWYGEEILCLKQNKKNEKSKPKIRKDGLSLKGGYLSWKPIKGSSSKREYYMKIVRKMGKWGILSPSVFEKPRSLRMMIFKRRSQEINSFLSEC